MKVKIYVKPSCVVCDIAKKYFNDKDIEFKEIDLSKDSEKEKEIFEKTNDNKVPVIEIDGEYIAGFFKDKIEKLIN